MLKCWWRNGVALAWKRWSIGDETLKRCGRKAVMACDVFLAVVTNAGKGT